VGHVRNGQELMPLKQGNGRSHELLSDVGRQYQIHDPNVVGQVVTMRTYRVPKIVSAKIVIADISPGLIHPRYELSV
jgi:hypothetical protein